MKLQVRDWLIVLLFALVVFTFWALRASEDNYNTTMQTVIQDSYSQQFQIDKLKACIDEKVSPCDINPSDYEAEE